MRARTRKKFDKQADELARLKKDVQEYKDTIVKLEAQKDTRHH